MNRALRCTEGQGMDNVVWGLVCVLGAAALLLYGEWKSSPWHGLQRVDWMNVFMGKALRCHQRNGINHIHYGLFWHRHHHMTIIGKCTVWFGISPTVVCRTVFCLSVHERTSPLSMLVCQTFCCVFYRHVFYGKACDLQAMCFCKLEL